MYIRTQSFIFGCCTPKDHTKVPTLIVGRKKPSSTIAKSRFNLNMLMSGGNRMAMLSQDNIISPATEQ